MKTENLNGKNELISWRKDLIKHIKQFFLNYFPTEHLLVYIFSTLMWYALYSWGDMPGRLVVFFITVFLIKDATWIYHHDKKRFPLWVLIILSYLMGVCWFVGEWLSVLIGVIVYILMLVANQFDVMENLNRGVKEQQPICKPQSAKIIDITKYLNTPKNKGIS